MNCKPGDLAYIVAGLVPENVGRIVKVVSAYGEYLDFGFCWRVTSNAPLYAFNALTGECFVLSFGWIPDSWLRPINGVPAHDDVLDEVTA